MFKKRNEEEFKLMEVINPVITIVQLVIILIAVYMIVNEDNHLYEFVWGMCLAAFGWQMGWQMKFRLYMNKDYENDMKKLRENKDKEEIN